MWMLGIDKMLLRAELSLQPLSEVFQCGQIGARPVHKMLSFSIAYRICAARICSYCCVCDTRISRSKLRPPSRFLYLQEANGCIWATLTGAGGMVSLFDPLCH